MRTKILLIFCFCVFSFVHAQKLKTTKILGETYGISYSKSDEMFTVCEKISDLNKSCNQKKIGNDNVFEFQENLRKYINTNRDNYKYNFFGSELTWANFKTIDFKTLNFDIEVNKLITINNEISFQFDKSPDQLKFKIKQTSNNNFEINCDKVFTKPLKFFYSQNIVANKANFIDEIKKEIEANKKTEIIDFFTEMVKTKFLDLLQELYNTTITKDADYEFLVSEKLKDLAGNTYAYSFYQLLDDKKFHIRVCEAGNCKNFNGLANDISESDFVNTMFVQHALFDATDPTNILKLEKIYLLTRSKVSAKQVEADKKEFEAGLKSTIAALEGGANTYSGQFVLRESVQLYKQVKDSIIKKSKDGNNKTFKSGKPKYKIFSKIVKVDDVKLLVDSVHVHVFNNRSDKITVTGRLSNDTDNTRILRNLTYSLPLREFNNDKEFNWLFDSDDNLYYYRYVDVLDFLPYGKYNYAVKNGEYAIGKEDSVLVPERKIGDYFTGIFFSDILGLNSNNGNSLITAEGRIRIPWNFRNYGRSTLLDNITAYASVNLVSGLDNTSRKIVVSDTFDPDETSAENAANFRSNNFNLLYNNNVDAGVLVTPYTFEWKGASTFIHFRYGLRFLRTGVEYNLKEQIENEENGVTTVQENLVEQRRFQVYSLGQEAEINFEIRPQSLFGADVTVGLNWFRANGTNKNDVDFSTFNNAPNLKVMTNIYAFTNSDESNSGIFLRLGGHYNLGNYKVFPQLMVGYATNLSSFVNKLAKDD